MRDSGRCYRLAPASPAQLGCAAARRLFHLAGAGWPLIAPRPPTIVGSTQHGSVDPPRLARFLMRLGRLKLGAMTGDSDDSRPRASSSPLPPPPSSPPLPTPPQPQQPRWAWWVVGVLIPVVGIIVTLIISNQGSSPSAGSDPPTEVTDSASAAASGGETRGNPPKVRFGPGNIDVPDQSNIELDSEPPFVVANGTKGTDLYISTPTLVSEESGQKLAPLPPSGSDPSEAECAEQAQNNGTYQFQLTRGARVCAQSDEGRTAYIRAVVGV